ncbi:hypothetical protein FOCG_11515 [Fusarium oxysporum f. sp. radicis-lycopersici 26381]|uniref:Uncharacterized protein n=1 Tax=Fusarium oxysporum Fo47 TaxID=660027 RepID=W9KZU3_FUSOX|nr:hypothetical protein FOZG_02689 [Fusarium oxysporum Fo47]EXL47309.1 hypothetical protein FOCG_11515 [Fusarium oxysporum f. sp. radicis-lycopersici 26381]
MSSLSNPDLDLETASVFSDDFQSPQIESGYSMYGMGGTILFISAISTMTVVIA